MITVPTDLNALKCRVVSQFGSKFGQQVSTVDCNNLRKTETQMEAHMFRIYLPCPLHLLIRDKLGCKGRIYLRPHTFRPLLEYRVLIRGDRAFAHTAPVQRMHYRRLLRTSEELQNEE